MKIGKLFGIDIVIHVSWIFVFALVAWMLGSDVGPLAHVDVPPPMRALLGLVAALLFFASVLAHELTHSVVARTRGIPVSRITLFIFGGVSSLSSEPATAGAEGWVAFVGPLSSLVLAGLFSAAGGLLGVRTPFGAVFQYLAYANLVLAVFNLLPALPLDGGRVLHALVWARTRDRVSALRIAVGVGRAIAAGIIALGILDSLFAGFGGGLWLIFVGWFILQAGSAELARAEATAALRGLKAADLAAPDRVALPADSSTSTAFDSLLKHGESSAPVVLDGRLLGLVSLYDIAKVDAQARTNTPVTAVMKRAQDVQSVRPDADAEEVLRLFAQTRHRQIPVVDANGALLGSITREGLLARVAAGGA